MPLILVSLSATIPVSVLHAYLTTLYGIPPGAILMDDGDRETEIMIDRSPQIWCTYYRTRGEFPTYLELSVAPWLMPSLDATRSDYWFATQACREFDCHALIPLASSDSYSGSGARAWVRPGHPLYRVFLEDDWLSDSNPIIVIVRWLPIEPIDTAIYEQGPPLYGLSITIDWWPGWDGSGVPVVEGRFSDISGRQWVFHEKVSYLTAVELDAQSVYPQPGMLQCCILDRSERDGRSIITITTREPWRLKATTGDDQFDVEAGLVTPLSMRI